MSKSNSENMNSKSQCLNNLVSFGDSNYQPLAEVLASLEGLLPPESVTLADSVLPLNDSVGKQKSIIKVPSDEWILPPGYCYEVLSKTLSDGSKQDVFPSYSLGLSALQDACNSEFDCQHPYIVTAAGDKLYVPLTASQTCAAKLLQPELLDLWFDTCSGVLYKSEGKDDLVKRIKVILFCERLSALDSSFNKPYLSMDYDAVLVDGKNVFELLVDDTYNHRLDKKDALEHKGLLVAFNNAHDVLEKFCDKVYESGKQTGFFVLEKAKEDQLRALGVGLNDWFNSDLVGRLNLLNDSRFVRVARAKNFP